MGMRWKLLNHTKKELINLCSNENGMKVSEQAPQIGALMVLLLSPGSPWYDAGDKIEFMQTSDCEGIEAEYKNVTDAILEQYSQSMDILIGD